MNLVEPGALYGDRVNQLDFRVAKILRFGRYRTQVGLDLYNALNSSAVQTYNQTLGRAVADADAGAAGAVRQDQRAVRLLSTVRLKADTTTE